MSDRRQTSAIVLGTNLDIWKAQMSTNFAPDFAIILEFSVFPSHSKPKSRHYFASFMSDGSPNNPAAIISSLSHSFEVKISVSLRHQSTPSFMAKITSNQWQNLSEFTNQPALNSTNLWVKKFVKILWKIRCLRTKDVWRTGPCLEDFVEKLADR